MRRCRILRIVQIHSQISDVLLGVDRSVLYHANVERAIVELLSCLVDENWNNQGLSVLVVYHKSRVGHSRHFFSLLVSSD